MEQIRSNEGRKHYVDNLRWITVVLVVLYHVFYNFNSVGVIKNIGVNGIPALDAPLYFIYPWFMCLLFVLAGMSARYSLAKRTAKEFRKERVRKLLIPSVAGIFILGWYAGYVTNQYTDMFMGAGEMIPGFVKYFIYCMCGIGPLWFAHELFLASMLLLLVRKIDKKDKLYELGGKVNLPVLLAFFLLVWGNSNILNTPLIAVYRNGIYLFMFFCGHYIFTHEKLVERLARYKVILLAAATVLGVVFTVHYWGQNYSEDAILRAPLTNLYAWIMVLALLGCGYSWLNKTNAFCTYMNRRNFAFYALHYPLLMAISFPLLTHVKMPMPAYYIVILVAEVILLPVVSEIIVRIPVIKRLLLGE